MSFPAARLGDMTAHGGVIVLGFPMVLIGGMPAARVTDMHVCPMLTGPVPHVGGPVTMGGNMVLIGGLPAARSTSLVTCVGPPDVITMGSPMVLIGDAGGGAGGGGGGGGGAGNDAGTSASVTTSGGNTSTEGPHWITFVFVDSGGTPISGVAYSFTDPDGVETQSRLSSSGSVSWHGQVTGQGTVTLRDISNARWSQTEARVGDTVKLTADVEGYPPGTKATFDIYERDVVGADDFIISIEGQTQANKVEVEWEYQYIEDTDDIQTEEDVLKGYSAPEYYFIVKVEGQQVRSGLLRFRDYIEIELKDSDERPIAGEDYILYLSNGEVRKGKLDGKGFKREENVPPVKFRVRFPNTGNIVKAE